MWFDAKNKQLHLYGAASLKYTSIEVKAGYILLDYGANELTATPLADTSGQLAGSPEFKDGTQSFTAAKLRYNFKSKKGIIFEARTKQEDLFVLGEKAKFISAKDTSERPTIYNNDAIITTCDAPHPHFGIRTKKLKVIPDKLVVMGLSNVEIAGIPTPLVLPFGFYPITKTKKAGLIIPRDFEFADREGLGIKDWGWYQPISEHLDARALFSVYVSGSIMSSLELGYNRRYRETGNFNLRYNRRVTENAKAEKVASPSFGLRWNHNQDSKAHPTRTFGGSVNIETNRDQNRNRNDYNQVYQNTLNSNLNYSQRFPGKPINLTAGFNHSQNTQTRQMTINFPSAQFTLQRIYPFKRRNPVGAERFYEKISLSYNSQLQNTLNAADTTLLTARTLNTMRTGIQHQAQSDVNFKLFRYINFTPSVNYREIWSPYITERRLDRTIRPKFDTIIDGEVQFIRLDSNATQWGKLDTLRNYQFGAYRNFDVSMSMGTALFFTKQFKKGWFRGIRHSIKPSVSAGWGTDYSNRRFDNIFKALPANVRPGSRDTVRYTIFDEGAFGGPSRGFGKREVALNYSLGNLLEIKYATRDTTKKLRIFDNLTFSGSYRLTADTLRFTTISTGGVFRFFKGITNVSWGVTLDPYILNERGRRVNQFAIRETGKLLRLDQFNMVFNTGFSVSQLREMLTKKEDTDTGKSGGTLTRTANQDADTRTDFVGWFDDFRVSHNVSINRSIVPGSNRDTLLFSGHSLSVQGSLQLTPKWSFNVSNISYDFASRQIVYPDFGFTRDLHCWVMSLSWQPTRGTYQFYINVKPGTLDFLKLPYRKNNFDARR